MVRMKYEIWSATDRIFCYFRPFFCLFTPKPPKKSKFLKYEKIPTDIIILNMRNINDNHMMYGSCDTEQDKQSFC